MLDRINTNGMLQVRRPHKAISLDACVMCGVNSKSVSHLFLHCPVADFLWSTLFGIFGECWVCFATVDQLLLTSFVGFGKKEAKSLWHVLYMPLFLVFGWNVILAPSMIDS